LPVDLVIIMLGTNDLKPVFNRTPLRIAIGAAHLIDLVNTLNGGVGTTYKNPKVLLICPPPLNPEIEKGPVFGEMFKGGLEKSQKLPELYEAVAKMGGAEFLNAGSVISTDGTLTLGAWRPVAKFGINYSVHIGLPCRVENSSSRIAKS
jgi:lysophospholipase L1-like esterase